MNMIKMIDFDVKKSVVKACGFMVAFMFLIILAPWMAYVLLFLFLILGLVTAYFVYKEWSEKKMKK